MIRAECASRAYWLFNGFVAKKKINRMLGQKFLRYSAYFDGYSALYINPEE
jgi:hypothetical protein